MFVSSKTLNRSFRSYDSIEGTQCFTTKENMSQMEAAIQGVREIGLNRIRALQETLHELFAELNSLRGTQLDRMFQARLDILSRK